MKNGRPVLHAKKITPLEGAACKQAARETKKKQNILIDRSFYEQNTLDAARELLGCKIYVRLKTGEIKCAIIAETEAYCGVSDLACHSSRGRTPRTEIMFGPPGFAYVYMIYGMYHCLNFVTEKPGDACAVLIRSVITENANDGTAARITGPGRTCRFFNIDKSFNGADITVKNRIWVEKRKLTAVKYTTAARVGIDYAGEYKDRPWRFILDD